MIIVYGLLKSIEYNKMEGDINKRTNSALCRCRLEYHFSFVYTINSIGNMFTKSGFVIAYVYMKS
jgi:hypothetical protein